MYIVLYESTVMTKTKDLGLWHMRLCMYYPMADMARTQGDRTTCIVKNMCKINVSLNNRKLPYRKIR